MSALRTSYSISPEILLRFNEVVPANERSRTIQNLIENVLIEKEKALEIIAEEFSTHPDFKQAREDSMLWDATNSDGLEDTLI